MKNPNTPTRGDEELKSIMEGLSNEKRDALLEMLQQDQKERNKASFESLYGNEKAILEDIKKNYLTVTWDVTHDMHRSFETVPIKGRVIKLELPEVPGSDFKGFKIDLFVSSYDVSLLNIDSKTEKELCTKEKLENILRAINSYMRAYGVKLDENIDFNGDLKDVTCKTWEYVEDLLGIRGWIIEEKTKYGGKLLEFSINHCKNDGGKANYNEPYYYDNPESNLLPPSNPLIVLLSD